MTPITITTRSAYASRLRVSLNIVLSLAAATASAQIAPSATPDARTLARYDLNKNGRLDPDELATLRADEARNATAAGPTTPTGSGNDQVVELSPFQVTAGEDKGYY